MDWLTMIVGFLVIIIGLGAYAWQLSNVLLTSNQWLSPHDKTVLITGCDTGIGHELAKHFYLKGCIVFATVLDIDGSGAQELRRLSDSSGDDNHRRMRLIRMDVTNDEDVSRAAAEVDDYLKRNQSQGLYALINNAGVCVMAEFDWLSWNQIQKQVDTNVLGTIRVTKTLLPLIIQSKGRIINVSSVNGNCAYPGIGVYCATKHAIEGLSDSLRVELSKFGVKVIVIKPGDYARLTSIMSTHSAQVSEMRRSMDDQKRQLYGQYFDDYHESVLKNSGLTSPKTFRESTLVADFEEAVLAVNPRRYIISASVAFRLFFAILYFTPLSVRDRLFSYIVSKMVRFDANGAQTTPPTVAPAVQTHQ